MLKYRRLGLTDLHVSTISLGAMTWGDQNTEGDGHRQLDLAVDFGVNLVDTSENYPGPPRKETQGSSERFIGTWLKNTGKRDKVLLATKASGPSDRHYLRADGSLPRLNSKSINEAIDNSLKRLQTDYLDLYQLHWPNRPLPLFGAETPSVAYGADAEEVTIEETLSALDDLVRSGKVRAIGLCNETPWGLARYLHLAATKGQIRVASLQNVYNLLNRTYESGLSEFQERERVGLLAYSPLAQGFLTGKYQQGERPQGARATLLGDSQRYSRPGVEEAVDKYLTIARDFDLDPAQFALAYVTSRPFVTSAIVGATKIEQLTAALKSTEIVLTPEIISRIDVVHRLYRNPAAP